MKTVDRNLLLLGLPALLLLIAGVWLYFVGDGLMDAAQSLAPEAPGGDVGDVEGYAFLLQFIGSGFGQLAGLMVLVFSLLLGVYGGAMVALNLLARALYRPTPGRLLAYRVVIGADLAVLLLPAPSLLATFFRTAAQEGRFDLLPLILAGLQFLLAALAIRNTYTRRIHGGPPKV